MSRVETRLGIINMLYRKRMDDLSKAQKINRINTEPFEMYVKAEFLIFQNNY